MNMRTLALQAQRIDHAADCRGVAFENGNEKEIEDLL